MFEARASPQKSKRATTFVATTFFPVSTKPTEGRQRVTVSMPRRKAPEPQENGADMRDFFNSAASKTTAQEQAAAASLAIDAKTNAAAAEKARAAADAARAGKPIKVYSDVKRAVESRKRREREKLAQERKAETKRRKVR